MGHLQEVETTLRELIAQNDAEALVVWVKERVLQSYKNGLAHVGRKAPARAKQEHAWTRAKNVEIVHGLIDFWSGEVLKQANAVPRRRNLMKRAFGVGFEEQGKIVGAWGSGYASLFLIFQPAFIDALRASPPHRRRIGQPPLDVDHTASLGMLLIRLVRRTGRTFRISVAIRDDYFLQRKLKLSDYWQEGQIDKRLQVGGKGEELFVFETSARQESIVNNPAIPTLIPKFS